MIGLEQEGKEEGRTKGEAIYRDKKEEEERYPRFLSDHSPRIMSRFNSSDFVKFLGNLCLVQL